MKSVNVREIWRLPLYAGNEIKIGRVTYRYYPMDAPNNDGRQFAIVTGEDILVFDTFREMVSTLEQLENEASSNNRMRQSRGKDKVTVL